MLMKNVNDIHKRIREKYSPSELDPEILCEIIHIIFDYIDQPKNKTMLTTGEDMQYCFNKIGEEMDKKIKEVKKDIQKGEKKKALKDTKELLKMDKNFDKKLDKCDGMMKKKKK